MAGNAEKGALYRMIWRWHFYAGLFVMPMVLILSITGAVYLFKPQVERWEELAFQGLDMKAAVTPSRQLDAALAAYPGATFQSYRLPERPGDAALIHVAMPGGTEMRDVFVSPQGNVLGSINPERRIMQIAHDVHGQLLLGPRGSWLVELAASWAIVMIVTGLYLWWPSGGGIAGVLWPRLNNGKRMFWRDIHAVTGFWVSAFALVLLVTGLPWAGVWGSGFKAVRTHMGWVKGAQDWTIAGRAADAGEHAMHMEHDHAMMMSGMAMPGMPMAGAAPALLDTIVANAEAGQLAFPVLVTPPGVAAGFGAKGSAVWTVRSDSQNRPLRTTISFDAHSGRELGRENFADKHVIDRVVGYGVAWHEGQLFGPVNQLIGVATAIALVTLTVSGFIMWRRRKPLGTLGAPPRSNLRAHSKAVVAITAFFFVTLPLFALSLVVLWLFDRFVLPKANRLSLWLGR